MSSVQVIDRQVADELLCLTKVTSRAIEKQVASRLRVQIKTAKSESAADVRDSVNALRQSAQTAAMNVVDDVDTLKATVSFSEELFRDQVAKIKSEAKDQLNVDLAQIKKNNAILRANLHAAFLTGLFDEVSADEEAVSMDETDEDVAAVADAAGVIDAHTV